MCYVNRQNRSKLIKPLLIQELSNIWFNKLKWVLMIRSI